MVLRLGALILRQTTLVSQRPAALRDGRIAKGLSLLLLELLTIGPSAVHISLLADFIPLSVGSLIVLGKVASQYSFASLIMKSSGLQP